MINFKVKFISIFIICILIFSLYININNINFDISKIYAAVASSTSTKTPNNGSDMTSLLARLVNGEAMGEPYIGQVAVAAVVLNRVKSPLFPNTISGVIYQKNQFSCVKDGNFDKPIDKNSTIYKAAKEAMNGADPTNGALYFYNPKTTKSKWLFTLKTLKTIANHRFAIENK